MKYSVTIPVAVLFFATLFSCQKANEIVVPKTEPDVHTLRVAFPSLSKPDGTKVSLATSGKTQWEVGDKMVIFGRPDASDDTKRIVHEIVAKDIENPEVAVFDVDLSGLTAETNTEDYHAYNVAFPYTDGQQYYYATGADNNGRIRFQETNQLLMSGYVNDGLNSIVLNHLTAAITFSVSGDYDSYVFSGLEESEVVGYSNFMVEVKKSGEGMYRQKYKDGGTTGPLTSITGPVNGNGTAVNYVFLPVNADRSGSSPNYTYNTESTRYADVVYLPSGFMIKFVKNGNIVKYISSSAPLVMEPGHIVNLGVLPPESIHNYVSTHPSSIPIGSVKKDLGGTDDGTANCYFINPADAITNEEGSIFKFEAVKGNSSESVGDISSVSVLWWTFNNATTPGANAVIKDVDYDNTGAKTYVVFQLPDSPQPGNAVIAAKNAVGTILWSWHIWVPASEITSNDYGIYKADKVMQDRNLGALSVAVASTTENIDVTSIGLVYQWGRKDPFLALDKIEEGKYRSWAAYSGTDSFTAEERVLSLDESIQNPTLFAKGITTNPNWLSPYDKELWGDSGSKAKYDPCPPGYRVPNQDSSCYLFGDNSGTYDITNAPGWGYDMNHYWFKLGNPVTVFPCAGYRNGGDYSFKSTFRTIIWNAHSSSSKGDYDEAYYSAYNRRIEKDGSNIKVRNDSQSKFIAGSVRCVAE